MNEYFKNIGIIEYEGPKSRNPLAFKYYNANELVGNKKMGDHLKFALSYWHTMTGKGDDPFGLPTLVRPWDNMKARADAAFEFMNKLGLEYFCFHDIDLSHDNDSLNDKYRALDTIVAYIKEQMKDRGLKLLWGTTNAFSHPRFMHGAASSCNADVFAVYASQVKRAMDYTLELGGDNYVFWGGREGYESLLNTNMALEEANLGRFFHMAVDYAKSIGYKGQLLIEPKPKEPTKHQYDFDAASVIGFLGKYNLKEYFKLNIEANHAALAGHTFQHELQVARINGMLGSIDANQGDYLLGWDTDQFPTNIYDASLCMYEVLKNENGLGKGGLNFDAKVRRPSFTQEDLVYSYIVAMDTFAKALKIAYKLLEDRVFEDFIDKRYESYNRGIGKEILDGTVGFKELDEYAFKLDKLELESGRQEMLEGLLNQYIFEEGR